MSFLRFSTVLVIAMMALSVASPETSTRGSVEDSPPQLVTDENAKEQMAKQIYAVIEHYKQLNPVGLPDGLLPLPDPTDVPDIAQSISMGNLKMTKVKLSGISQFIIRYFSTEVKDMKARCEILFETLTLKGDYQLSSFIYKSKGPFTIKLKDVLIDGNSTIAVEKDGKLRTEYVNIDITFKDMSMDFQNLGLVANVFQSIANSASNVIFDSIKPMVLKDAYAKVKESVDANLANLVGPDVQIPNSISPIDNAIAEARNLVRAKGFDPFHVEDYNYPGVFGVKIFNTWLYGISSFYRLGELALIMKNNSLIVTMEIGTQEIAGTTMWQVSIARGMITRAGNLHFTVQHIKVLFELQQPLNLSKKMKINDLQLDLGNIQIRCSGLGTADYLVEFFVNVMPNLLRYQIMDALEKPLMRKIQDFTDKIDVEQLVKEKLNEYQNTGSVKMDLHLEL